jgi:hypothetical protein
LRETIAETPIPENEVGEEDWNSQNWIWDALEGLVGGGLLDVGDKDRALEEMLDVVLEAGDEHGLV